MATGKSFTSDFYLAAQNQSPDHGMLIDSPPSLPMAQQRAHPTALQLLGYFDQAHPTVNGRVAPGMLSGDGSWKQRFLGFGEGSPWTEQTHASGIPDSLLGRSPYMMNTINASVIGSSDFYATELLPYSQTDNLHVAWDVLRMNEQLAGRVPEGGVSRLLTWEKHTRTQSSVRRGLSMQLEADTFNTPEGARHFMMELDGLVRAVRATINLDVMTALMDCATQADAKAEGAKRFRGVAGLTRVAAREIDGYALLQSRANALEILIAESREQMSRRGAVPDTVILPPGALSYLAQRPEYQGAFSAYSRQVGATIYGCKVYEAEYVCVGDRASTTVGERDMRCPLVRPTDVGELYHVTDGGAVSLSTLNACGVAATLYSEIQDRWIGLPMRDLLQRGNSRFSAAPGGSLKLELAADETLGSLAKWASQHWDATTARLMPRDARMLLRPDWAIYRDWTVSSQRPGSYKPASTLWHLSQAQFPSLFLPAAFARTRSMLGDQTDALFFPLPYHNAHKERVGGVTIAGEVMDNSGALYRNNSDALLWAGVSHSLPYHYEHIDYAELAAEVMPNEHGIVDPDFGSAVHIDFETVLKGNPDNYDDGAVTTLNFNLRMAAAYWHYVEAKHPKQLRAPNGSAGLLYENHIGDGAIAQTQQYGCSFGPVDSHNTQMALLMWYFVSKYEQKCESSGFSGDGRNGTLLTLRTFVNVFFKQKQRSANNSVAGSEDIIGLVVKSQLERARRVENPSAEVGDWIAETADLIIQPGGASNADLRAAAVKFAKLDRQNFVSGKFRYAFPVVWSVLFQKLDPRICGEDEHSELRMQAALRRASARYTERVASCVGGRGVVDVGRNHVCCPDDQALDQHKRARSDPEVHPTGGGGGGGKSAVAATDEDVLYMAALFASYASDMLSACVVADEVYPLASAVPDAVLDTYAHEWLRAYSMTREGGDTFDGYAKQRKFGFLGSKLDSRNSYTWSERLFHCATSLAMVGDGVFSALSAHELDCYTTKITWRKDGLTSRAVQTFGVSSRVVNSLAVPPASVAMLLFVSAAYDNLSREPGVDPGVGGGVAAELYDAVASSLEQLLDKDLLSGGALSPDDTLTEEQAEAVAQKTYSSRLVPASFDEPPSPIPQARPRPPSETQRPRPMPEELTVEDILRLDSDEESDSSETLMHYQKLAFAELDLAKLHLDLALNGKLSGAKTNEVANLLASLQGDNIPLQTRSMLDKDPKKSLVEQELKKLVKENYSALLGSGLRERVPKFTNGFACMLRGYDVYPLESFFAREKDREMYFQVLDALTICFVNETEFLAACYAHARHAVDGNLAGEDLLGYEPTNAVYAAINKWAPVPTMPRVALQNLMGRLQEFQEETSVKVCRRIFKQLAAQGGLYTIVCNPETQTFEFTRDGKLDASVLLADGEWAKSATDKTKVQDRSRHTFDASIQNFLSLVDELAVALDGKLNGNKTYKSVYMLCDGGSEVENPTMLDCVEAAAVVKGVRTSRSPLTAERASDLLLSVLQALALCRGGILPDALQRAIFKAIVPDNWPLFLTMSDLDGADPEKQDRFVRGLLQACCALAEAATVVVLAEGKVKNAFMTVGDVFVQCSMSPLTWFAPSVYRSQSRVAFRFGSDGGAKYARVIKPEEPSKGLDLKDQVLTLSSLMKRHCLDPRPVLQEISDTDLDKLASVSGAFEVLQTEYKSMQDVSQAALGLRTLAELETLLLKTDAAAVCWNMYFCVVGTSASSLLNAEGAVDDTMQSDLPTQRLSEEVILRSERLSAVMHYATQDPTLQCADARPVLCENVAVVSDSISDVVRFDFELSDGQKYCADYDRVVQYNPGTMTDVFRRIVKSVQRCEAFKLAQQQVVNGDSGLSKRLAAAGVIAQDREDGGDFAQIFQPLYDQGQEDIGAVYDTVNGLIEAYVASISAGKNAASQLFSPELLYAVSHIDGFLNTVGQMKQVAAVSDSVVPSDKDFFISLFKDNSVEVFGMNVLLLFVAKVVRGFAPLSTATPLVQRALLLQQKDNDLDPNDFPYFVFVDPEATFPASRQLEATENEVDYYVDAALQESAYDRIHSKPVDPDRAAKMFNAGSLLAPDDSLSTYSSNELRSQERALLFLGGIKIGKFDSAAHGGVISLYQLSQTDNKDQEQDDYAKERDRLFKLMDGKAVCPVLTSSKRARLDKMWKEFVDDHAFRADASVSEKNACANALHVLQQKHADTVNKHKIACANALATKLGLVSATVQRLKSGSGGFAVNYYELMVSELYEHLLQHFQRCVDLGCAQLHNCCRVMCATYMHKHFRLDPLNFVPHLSSRIFDGNVEAWLRGPQGTRVETYQLTATGGDGFGVSDTKPALVTEGRQFDSAVITHSVNDDAIYDKTSLRCAVELARIAQLQGFQLTNGNAKSWSEHLNGVSTEGLCRLVLENGAKLDSLLRNFATNGIRHLAASVDHHVTAQAVRMAGFGDVSVAANFVRCKTDVDKVETRLSGLQIGEFEDGFAMLRRAIVAAKQAACSTVRTRVQQRVDSVNIAKLASPFLATTDDSMVYSALARLYEFGTAHMDSPIAGTPFLCAATKQSMHGLHRLELASKMIQAPAEYRVETEDLQNGIAARDSLAAAVAVDAESMIDVEQLEKKLQEGRLMKAHTRNEFLHEAFYKPRADVAAIYEAGYECLSAKKTWWELHAKAVSQSAQPQQEESHKTRVLRETRDDFNGSVPFAASLNERNSVRKSLRVALSGLTLGAASVMHQHSQNDGNLHGGTTGVESALLRSAMATCGVNWRNVAQQAAGATNDVLPALRKTRAALYKAFQESYAVKNYELFTPTAVDLFAELRRKCNNRDLIFATNLLKGDVREMNRSAVDDTKPQNAVNEAVEQVVADVNTVILDRLTDVSAGATSNTRSFSDSVQRFRGTGETNGAFVNLFATLGETETDTTLLHELDDAMVKFFDFFALHSDSKAAIEADLANGNLSPGVRQALRAMHDRVDLRVEKPEIDKYCGSVVSKIKEERYAQFTVFVFEDWHRYVLNAGGPVHEALERIEAIESHAFQQTCRESVLQQIASNWYSKLGDDGDTWGDSITLSVNVLTQASGTFRDHEAYAVSANLHSAIVKFFDSRASNGVELLATDTKEQLRLRKNMVTDWLMVSLHTFNSVTVTVKEGDTDTLKTALANRKFELATAAKLEREDVKWRAPVQRRDFQDALMEDLDRISGSGVTGEFVLAADDNVKRSVVHDPGVVHAVVAYVDSQKTEAGASQKTLSEIVDENFFAGPDIPISSAFSERGAIAALGVTGTTGVLKPKARKAETGDIGDAEDFDALYETAHATRCATHQLSAACSLVDCDQADASGAFASLPTASEMLGHKVTEDSYDLAVVSKVRGLARSDMGEESESEFVLFYGPGDRLYSCMKGPFDDAVAKFKELALNAKIGAIETYLADVVAQGDIATIVAGINKAKTQHDKQEFLVHAVLVVLGATLVASAHKPMFLTAVCDAAFYNDVAAHSGGGFCRGAALSKQSSPMSVFAGSLKTYADLTKVHSGRSVNGQPSRNPRWDEERHLRSVLRRNVALSETDLCRHSPSLQSLQGAIMESCQHLPNDTSQDLRSFAMHPTDLGAEGMKYAVRRDASESDKCNLGESGDPVPYTDAVAHFLREGCDRDVPHIAEASLAAAVDYAAAVGRDSLLHFDVGNQSARAQLSAPRSQHVSRSVNIYDAVVECLYENHCYAQRCDLLNTRASLYAQALLCKRIDQQLERATAAGPRIVEPFSLFPPQDNPDKGNAAFWTAVGVKLSPGLLNLWHDRCEVFAPSVNMVVGPCYPTETAEQELSSFVGLSSNFLQACFTAGSAEHFTHAGMDCLCPAAINTHPDEEYQNLALHNTIVFREEARSKFAKLSRRNRERFWIGWAACRHKRDIFTHNWAKVADEEEGTPVQFKEEAPDPEDVLEVANLLSELVIWYCERVGADDISEPYLDDDYVTLVGEFEQKTHDAVTAMAVLAFLQIAPLSNATDGGPEESVRKAGLQILGVATDNSETASFASPLVSSGMADSLHLVYGGFQEEDAGRVTTCFFELENPPELDFEFLRGVGALTNTGALANAQLSFPDIARELATERLLSLSPTPENLQRLVDLGSPTAPVDAQFRFMLLYNEEGANEMLRDMLVQNFDGFSVYEVNEQQVKQLRDKSVGLVLLSSIVKSQFYVVCSPQDTLQEVGKIGGSEFNLTTVTFVVHNGDGGVGEAKLRALEEEVGTAGEFVDVVRQTTADATLRRNDVLDGFETMVSLVNKYLDEHVQFEMMQTDISCCVDESLGRQDKDDLRVSASSARVVKLGCAEMLGSLQQQLFGKVDEYRDRASEPDQIALSHLEETERSSMLTRMFVGLGHKWDYEDDDWRDPLFFSKAVRRDAELQLSLSSIVGELKTFGDEGGNSAVYSPYLTTDQILCAWRRCCVDVAANLADDEDGYGSTSVSRPMSGGEHDTQVGARTPLEQERDTGQLLYPSRLDNAKLLRAQSPPKPTSQQSSSSFLWFEDASPLTASGTLLFALGQAMSERACDTLRQVGLHEGVGVCAFPGMYGDDRHLLDKPRTTGERILALIYRVEMRMRQAGTYTEDPLQRSESVKTCDLVRQFYNAVLDATQPTRADLIDDACVILLRLKGNQSALNYLKSVENEECGSSRRLCDKGRQLFKDSCDQLYSGAESTKLNLLSADIPIGFFRGESGPVGICSTVQTHELQRLKKKYSKTVGHKALEVPAAIGSDDKYGNYFGNSHSYKQFEVHVGRVQVRNDRESDAKVELDTSSISTFNNASGEPEGGDLGVSVRASYLHEAPKVQAADPPFAHQMFSDPDDSGLNKSLHTYFQSLADTDAEATRSLQLTPRQKRSVADVCPLIFADLALCTHLDDGNDTAIERTVPDRLDAMRRVVCGLQIIRTPSSAFVSAAESAALETLYTESAHASTYVHSRALPVKSLGLFYKFHKTNLAFAITETFVNEEAQFALQEQLGAFAVALQSLPLAPDLKDQIVSRAQQILEAAQTSIDKQDVQFDDLIPEMNSRVRELLTPRVRKLRMVAIRRNRTMFSDKVNDTHLFDKTDGKNFWYGGHVAQFVCQPGKYVRVTARQGAVAKSRAQQTTRSCDIFAEGPELFNGRTEVSEMKQVVRTIAAQAEKVLGLLEDGGAVQLRLFCIQLTQLPMRFDGETVSFAVRKRLAAFCEHSQLPFLHRSAVEGTSYLTQLLVQLRQLLSHEVPVLGRHTQMKTKLSLCTLLQKPYLVDSGTGRVTSATLTDVLVFGFAADHVLEHLAQPYRATNQSNESFEGLCEMLRKLPPVFYIELRKKSQLAEDDLESMYALISDSKIFRFLTSVLDNLEPQLGQGAPSAQQVAELLQHAVGVAFGQLRYHRLVYDCLQCPRVLDKEQDEETSLSPLLGAAEQFLCSTSSNSRVRLWGNTLADAVSSVPTKDHTVYAHRQAQLRLQAYDCGMRAMYATFDDGADSGLGDGQTRHRAIVDSSLGVYIVKVPHIPVTESADRNSDQTGAYALENMFIVALQVQVDADDGTVEYVRYEDGWLPVNDANGTVNLERVAAPDGFEELQYREGQTIISEGDEVENGWFLGLVEDDQVGQQGPTQVFLQTRTTKPATAASAFGQQVEEQFDLLKENHFSMEKLAKTVEGEKTMLLYGDVVQNMLFAFLKNPLDASPYDYLRMVDVRSYNANDVIDEPPVHTVDKSVQERLAQELLLPQAVYADSSDTGLFLAAVGQRTRFEVTSILQTSAVRSLVTRVRQIVPAYIRASRYSLDGDCIKRVRTDLLQKQPLLLDKISGNTYTDSILFDAMRARQTTAQQTLLLPLSSDLYSKFLGILYIENAQISRTVRAKDAFRQPIATSDPQSALSLDWDEGKRRSNAVALLAPTEPQVAAYPNDDLAVLVRLRQDDPKLAAALGSSFTKCFVHIDSKTGSTMVHLDVPQILDGAPDCAHRCDVPSVSQCCFPFRRKEPDAKALTPRNIIEKALPWGIATRTTTKNVHCGLLCASQSDIDAAFLLYKAGFESGLPKTWNDNFVGVVGALSETGLVVTSDHAAPITLGAAHIQRDIQVGSCEAIAESDELLQILALCEDLHYVALELSDQQFSLNDVVPLGPPIEETDSISGVSYDQYPRYRSTFEPVRGQCTAVDSVKVDSEFVLQPDNSFVCELTEDPAGAMFFVPVLTGLTCKLQYVSAVTLPDGVHKLVLPNRSNSCDALLLELGGMLQGLDADAEAILEVLRGVSGSASAHPLHKLMQAPNLYARDDVRLNSLLKVLESMHYEQDAEGLARTESFSFPYATTAINPAELWSQDTVRVLILGEDSQRQELTSFDNQLSASRLLNQYQTKVNAEDLAADMARLMQFGFSYNRSGHQVALLWEWPEQQTRDKDLAAICSKTEDEQIKVLAAKFGMSVLFVALLAWVKEEQSGEFIKGNLPPGRQDDEMIGAIRRIIVDTLLRCMPYSFRYVDDAQGLGNVDGTSVKAFEKSKRFELFTALCCIFGTCSNVNVDQKDDLYDNNHTLVEEAFVCYCVQRYFDEVPITETKGGEGGQFYRYNQLLASARKQGLQDIVEAAWLQNMPPHKDIYLEMRDQIEHQCQSFMEEFKLPANQVTLRIYVNSLKGQFALVYRRLAGMVPAPVPLHGGALPHQCLHLHQRGDVNSNFLQCVSITKEKVLVNYRNLTATKSKDAFKLDAEQEDKLKWAAVRRGGNFQDIKNVMQCELDSDFALLPFEKERRVQVHVTVTNSRGKSIVVETVTDVEAFVYDRRLYFELNPRLTEGIRTYSVCINGQFLSDLCVCDTATRRVVNFDKEQLGSQLPFTYRAPLVRPRSNSDGKLYAAPGLNSLEQFCAQTRGSSQLYQDDTFELPDGDLQSDVLQHFCVTGSPVDSLTTCLAYTHKDSVKFSAFVPYSTDTKFEILSSICDDKIAGDIDFEAIKMTLMDRFVDLLRQYCFEGSPVAAILKLAFVQDGFDLIENADENSMPLTQPLFETIHEGFDDAGHQWSQVEEGLPAVFAHLRSDNIAKPLEQKLLPFFRLFATSRLQSLFAQDYAEHSAFVRNILLREELLTLFFCEYCDARMVSRPLLKDLSTKIAQTSLSFTFGDDVAIEKFALEGTATVRKLGMLDLVACHGLPFHSKSSGEAALVTKLTSRPGPAALEATTDGGAAGVVPDPLRPKSLRETQGRALHKRKWQDTTDGYIGPAKGGPPEFDGAGPVSVTSVSDRQNFSSILRAYVGVMWQTRATLRQRAQHCSYADAYQNAGVTLAGALARPQDFTEDWGNQFQKATRALAQTARRHNLQGSVYDKSQPLHVSQNMKLHVVATRPVIRHMMGSTIVMRRGEGTGRTLIGPENDFQLKQLPEPAGGQYHGNLTFYSKAFVQTPHNVHVRTGSYAVAYMNGNDTGPLETVQTSQMQPLGVAGDILTCILPESYDKGYALRGCGDLQEDIFGVWSDTMARVADCADAVDGSNGVHFACGPYNYMHLCGWESMANRPVFLHMQKGDRKYMAAHVHDWTTKRDSVLFGTERNTVCYPGPFVTLATGVLQDMDLRTSQRQRLLLGDDLCEAHYADVRERALNLRPPERACAGSGHWKNSVGVGFAGGRSGRYDVLDRRNAAMPAHAYGTVAPGECDTSGRPEISAPVALAGVYGATTQAHHPSLGSALNGLTY